MDAIHDGIGLEELSRREGVGSRYLRMRIQMAFLSPRIMKAILVGTQPAHLSTETFVRADIPTSWSEQEELFGFGG